MTRRRLILLSLFTPLGCVANSEESDICPTRQAVVDGSTSSPLGAALDEAVGALRINEALLCTGTYIGRDLVLTAAHCVEGNLDPTDIAIQFAPVAFEGEECREPRPMHPTSIALHPSQDIALLTLRSDDAQELGLGALSLAADAPAIADTVWFAGFGRDEDGVTGTRRFAESKVQQVDAETIVIESEFDRGACWGDSGGPLFVSVDNAWELAGVLSTGAASCTGRDEFVRLDTGDVREWLAQARQHEDE